MFYLEFDSINVTTSVGRTWKVYGSPVSLPTFLPPLLYAHLTSLKAAPRYSSGAFQYEYNRGKDVYAKIPEGTEVLLTHTPPFGTLNKTRKGVAAGCKDLTRRLGNDDLQQCRLHVFGHIHEAHGAVLQEESSELPHGRVSVNAALAYGGQAVIVDLQN